MTGQSVQATPVEAEALLNDFRTAMRGVASTIHIVTLTLDGAPKGMTATAVSSLSMNPPSLLVCMNETVSMHEPMAGIEWFCVNVLTTRHIAVARAFSDSRLRDVRFETGQWSIDDEPAPRLADAQAAMLCRRVGHHRFGTHSIFLGEVCKVRLSGARDPLVYLDGSFQCSGPVTS
jgi:flavin reductase (DIM6/NTAB) family NADH-FMN oxidoreductase RutF